MSRQATRQLAPALSDPKRLFQRAHTLPTASALEAPWKRSVFTPHLHSIRASPVASSTNAFGTRPQNGQGFNPAPTIGCPHVGHDPASFASLFSGWSMARGYTGAFSLASELPLP
jgi:hypothetical protein